MKVFISRKIPEIGYQLLRNAGLEVTAWGDDRMLTKEELLIIQSNMMQLSA